MLEHVGNLVVDDRVEVSDHCKVSKEHVDKEAVVLHMSFASSAHAIVGRVKSKDKMGKNLEVYVIHIRQMWPNSLSSSVLPCGLPPSPTVVAVVLVA